MANPEVSKSPLLLLVTHSKAPEIYFFQVGRFVAFSDDTPQWAVWRRQAQAALLMATPLPRATQTGQRKGAGALIIGHRFR